MFNVSREFEILQFHLENALFIDGYIIKAGLNILKRVEKTGKDYIIFHSDDFIHPYTHFPLDHVQALVKFISKALVEDGMIVIDEFRYTAIEIKPGTMKLVDKNNNNQMNNLTLISYNIQLKRA